MKINFKPLLLVFFTMALVLMSVHESIADHHSEADRHSCSICVSSTSLKSVAVLNTPPSLLLQLVLVSIATTVITIKVFLDEGLHLNLNSRSPPSKF
ncbi:MAG: hypothetical protein KBC84_00900 [Proteobacteria bacterium]|nr:hypothetical protein [Pseudomonadota bacterium]